MAIDVKKAVKVLNDHQLRHAAGFYTSTGGRGFLARIRKGVPEISYDFRTYQPVDFEAVTFHDHNGRAIALPKAKGG